MHTSPVCRVPQIPERVLSPDIDYSRARLIRYNQKKWVTGEVLNYYFFDNKTIDGPLVGDKAQREIVRKAFGHWKRQGIGLKFREVVNRAGAKVRIGFDHSDGSWSHVGRDIVDMPQLKDPNNPTMNFGWDLTDIWGWDTALHEIGHTLGFPHEHQNPKAGIVWNEKKVYEYFRGSPNYWDDDTIKHNVLRKLNPGEVSGSQWDPNSIMHYPFEPGLIEEPAMYRTQALEPAHGLSAPDIREVKSFYPPVNKSKIRTLKAFESKRLNLVGGQQASFAITPVTSRGYTIQTFGTCDSVMVLFEVGSSEGPHFVAGDDDSGIDRNAQIKIRLFRDRQYLLIIRLYYSIDETAVLLW